MFIGFARPGPEHDGGQSVLIIGGALAAVVSTQRLAIGMRRDVTRRLAIGMLQGLQLSQPAAAVPHGLLQQFEQNRGRSETAGMASCCRFRLIRYLGYEAE